MVENRQWPDLTRSPEIAAAESKQQGSFGAPRVWEQDGNAVGGTREGSGRERGETGAEGPAGPVGCETTGQGLFW